MIGLVSSPLSQKHRDAVTEKGYGIYYLAFEVENIHEAVEDLKAKNVEIVWEPVENSFSYHIGIKSSEGLLVIVLQLKDPKSFKSKTVKSTIPVNLTFNHTGVLTDDFRKSEKFWTEILGLTPTYEFSKDDSGYEIFIDNDYCKGHEFSMEILTPPYIYPIDQYGYDTQGISYYHLGYIAGSFENVEKAYNYMVEKGMFPASEPSEDVDFSTSFTHGQDRVIFEFVSKDLGAVKEKHTFDCPVESLGSAAIPYPTGKEFQVL
jgi:catechol 2,3-dioxygenase-like lactoylglutathione lyase family enzyme